MIFLGFGDTLSAVCGSNFGVAKWSNNKKTYIGTISGIVGSLMVNNMLMMVLWPGRANVKC